MRLYGEISSDLGALEKVLRKIGGEGVALRVAYEAGPTGFVLYRRLQQLKINCIVVAPTKTPMEKAGASRPTGATRSCSRGCTARAS